MCDQHAILILDRTKRGQNGKVVLGNGTVVSWLRSYLSHFPCANLSRVFAVSYTTVAKWMSKASGALNFGAMCLTTHSLRRGGATELLRVGVSFSDIAVFGRWASEQSVRIYLREGDVQLTRAAAIVDADTWARIARWGRLHEVVWLHYADA